MRKTRVTLKDIAKETGFSTNTVSLALRDSPRIPEVTREKIKTAAEGLNYLPNQIAQSLVSRETKTIGLILTNIRNPVLTQVAQEVGNLLADKGYSTLFSTSNNTVPKEKQVVDTFRRRQVDGILVYPTNHNEVEHLSKLRRMGYPIVSLIADPSRSIDSVGVDEVAGGLKATRHLIEAGCHRIALLDAAGPYGNLEKLDGYKKALAEAGLAFDDRLVAEISQSGIGPGYKALETLWHAGIRPDGLVCTNDSVALGAERWCEDNGLRVPMDIAIVGFDNIEFGQFASVPLSTVVYPVETISRRAVEHLMALINAQGDLPEPTETLFDPELLVRRSSDRGSVHE